MPAGRPLEPAGNGRPRWMTAGRDAARRPVHRIRLIGQLVRPALRRLRQRGSTAGLIRRKALATSPGFSVLLDVQRPDDGPSVDLARWGSCGIPSAWCSVMSGPHSRLAPSHPHPMSQVTGPLRCCRLSASTPVPPRGVASRSQIWSRAGTSTGGVSGGLAQRLVGRHSVGAAG
jgi:hypothetical protein